ncbi:hypothetical protein AC579_10264 [Pseudocercospora musae]|uniref:Srp40 C-terminal domain-containing protein n=2 Tax=Pseudocercospora musae TaxID=113226 RepID=A0A139I5C4_9PEZI|nr:hypothetical protein AC579_10264 [Pseudocercospora musae]
MADQQVPDALWPHQTPAPKLPEILCQISKFLGDLGYSKTRASLDKDAAKNGIPKPSDSDKAVSLMDYYQPTTPPATAGATDESSGSSSSDSESGSDGDDESENDEAEGVLVDVEAEETSDDDSDEKSDSGGSSDSSNSDRSSASEAKAGSKRKRVATPPSSDDTSSSSSDESMSDSDSDSSSDESDPRPAKKAKVEPVTAPSDSGSNSSSSSDAASSSSDSESDSSDSDGSSSSSSSESDSEAAPAPKKEKVKQEPVAKKEKPDTSARKAYVGTGRKEANKDGSQSSATLDAESAGETPGESEENSGMHPDRLKRLSQQQKTVTGIVDVKKKQVPFSRIPADQYVDPRFASNEYVSYDYADRAYQDLVVTKGKGFTKEKNKKKRGKDHSSHLHPTPRNMRNRLAEELGWALSPPPSEDDFSLSPIGGNALGLKDDLSGFCAYRGGAIDLTPKGIKFED